MIRREENGLVWWEFELLADYPVRHAIFTRHGGVSPAPYSSLNLASTVGDIQKNVEENLTRMQGVLSVSQLHTAQQCHGDVLQAVSKENLGYPIFCDGLHTSLKEVGLVVRHADCQPALFYDPKNHVAASVHCGWRGSVQNIYAATVNQLVHTYRTDPQDLLVCIGPSLGPKNAQFLNYQTELPPSFWPFQVKPCYFDFWAISRWQLETAGVLPHHIQIAEMDTYAQTDQFFSHRKEKLTGRNAVVIALH